MISQPTFFSFEEYHIENDGQTITFLYSQGFEGGRASSFQDKIILPEKIKASVSKELLDSIHHSLHFILGISYWKMYCSKEIRIKTKPLSHEQAEFWNIVYTKGLGEFFYRNDIDFKELVNFPFTNEVKEKPVSFKPCPRSLVGIAGGKDSLVTLEKMNETGKDMAGFVIETNYEYPLIRELLPKTGIRPIFVRHIIDEKVNALNETGLVLNGHVPISAIYAFLGVFAAIVYDYKYVIVSNEKSANIGNVIFNGLDVNHQWSKSEEFEMLFRAYVKQHITPDVIYFSLLRPLTEIKITELFSRYEKYFPYFSSCNKNFTNEVSRKKWGLTKENKWCGKCAKCAFVFAMLSAFLPKNKLVSIFKKNLYQDIALIPLFRQLLGIEDIKPFDCVGNEEEVLVAFFMAYLSNQYEGDEAMNMFKKNILPQIKDIGKLKQFVFEKGDNKSIPEEFRNII